MGKLTQLPQALAADGSEELLVVQGLPGAQQAKRMSAALFATAGTRPTPAELVAAILATLVEGAGIDLVDNGNNTVSIKLGASPALEGTPTAPTADNDNNSDQVATTAFVQAVLGALATIVDGKQGALVEGEGIAIVDNADGTFTVSSTATGSGSLPDGDYGDVLIETVGGVQTLTVQSGSNVDLTVPDAVYGAAWDGSTRPATRNAVYDKIELLVASIAGKVASTAVGAVNGVASLDATGKVPASQLPSFVDDVLEAASFATLPAVGESGKIYVTIDTNPNKSWRWSGSAYVEIKGSPGTTDEVVEGTTNKYFTDARTRAAVLTGLVDTAGTPAATDSLLVALGKIRKALFTDLPATIRGTVLTGLADTAGALAAGDTLLAALGKIKKTIGTDLPASIAAGRLLPTTDQAGSFNVENADTEKAYRYTGAGGHIATVLDTLAVGAIVTVYHDGTGGTLSITAGAGVTIVNLGAGNLTAFTIPQYSACTLHKVAAGRVLASVSR